MPTLEESDECEKFVGELLNYQKNKIKDNSYENITSIR